MSDDRDADETLAELAEPLGCVGFHLRRWSRAVTARYDRRLRPLGLRVTQWPLLSALRVAGAVSLGALADRVGMDASTLARNVRPLVREGWVDLVAGEDRREKYARLTPAGVVKWREVLPVWREVQRETLALLGEEEWRDVRRTLEALSRTPAPTPRGSHRRPSRDD